MTLTKIEMIDFFMLISEYICASFLLKHLIIINSVY